MPGYISEIDYYGRSDAEFAEIAVPEGTDISNYQLAQYADDGTYLWTLPKPTYRGTMDGQDVCVLDSSVAGFDDGGDTTGFFRPDSGLALIDDSGTVLQSISWNGNIITATDGPASGTTSKNIGQQSYNESSSMQSDDGGSTYYVQSSSNKNSIPACFGPGTLVRCENGVVAIENLKPGDKAGRCITRCNPWCCYGTIRPISANQTGRRSGYDVQALDRKGPRAT